jgi:hypothetical protein
MVRAIIEGRKTQTRRVVKHVVWNYKKPPYDAQTFMDINPVHREHPDGLCPYGDPGDLLWVRESFVTTPAYDGLGSTDVLYREDPMYDGMQPGDFAWRWKPSIHMPRKFSRITLRITGVRVQRVREITDEEAIAEGVQVAGRPEVNELSQGKFVHAFGSLWDSINAKRSYSWESNPWVWAISFEVVK